MRRAGANIAFDSRARSGYKDAGVAVPTSAGYGAAARQTRRCSVPLFNGKDTAGWRAPEGKGEWKVVGNVLTGHAGNGEYGVLPTLRHYSNFHLRAEVRLTGPGNSGILFRSEVGYQLEINDGTTGSIARSKPWAWLDRKEHTRVEPGAWCTLELIADGPTLTTKLNGQIISSVTDDSHTRGYIALEANGRDNGPMVVEFRKLEIKELPASKPNVAPKPILLKSFDPAKDKAVSLRGYTKEIVSVENGAWRIENMFGQSVIQNLRVALGTITEGIPEDGILICRAKVKLQPKHKDAWGDLELGTSSPSSEGYDWPRHLAEYRGEITEWTEKEVRYPAEIFRKKNPPTITVHVGLHANGVLWVKDVQLLYLPPAASRLADAEARLAKETPPPTAPAPRPKR